MSNKPIKHSEEKKVTSASRMKQEWAYKRRTRETYLPVQRLSAEAGHEREVCERWTRDVGA